MDRDTGRERFIRCGDRPARGAARQALVLVLLVVAALAIGLAIDLWGPVHADMREFDSRHVAQLDTQMWRAYYARKPLPVFLGLAELLRTQFHFPFMRSYRAAFHAARAAFVFKKGHERDDYLKAMPDLVAYYGDIRRISKTDFNVHRTSELELEWWIVHRERGLDDQDSLTHTVAAAAAELYRVPPAALERYGRARAEAMAIRDYQSSHGGVTEEDWAKIRGLLETSWRELSQAVQPGGPPPPAEKPATAPS